MLFNSSIYSLQHLDVKCDGVGSFSNPDPKTVLRLSQMIFHTKFAGELLLQLILPSGKHYIVDAYSNNLPYSDSDVHTRIVLR